MPTRRTAPPQNEVAATPHERSGAVWRMFLLLRALAVHRGDGAVKERGEGGLKVS